MAHPGAVGAVRHDHSARAPDIVGRRESRRSSVAGGPVRLKSRILVAYALILIIGISISILVAINGRSVLHALRPLVERAIPSMDALSRLEAATAAIEPILYEYYATTDRALFLGKIGANDVERHRRLAAISEVFPGDERLSEVRDALADLDDVRNRLDEVLRNYATSPVDWDRARALLEESSRTAGVVRRILEEMSAESRDAMLAATSVASAKTRSTIRVILGASLAVLVAAAVLAVMVHRFLLQAADRRRLALFVERNPNPVLRLDGTGQLEFANPSAFGLADRLGIPECHPRGLLPDAVGEHLVAIALGGGMPVRLEHRIRDTHLSIELHYIDEFDIYHAYLTDITTEHAARLHIEYIAFNDRLTGLPNRSSLERDLAALLAVPGTVSVSLLIANIDNWRSVVQSIGANKSDALLGHIGHRLREAYACVANVHGPYRVDGDTFAVIQSPVPDAEIWRSALATGLRRVSEVPLEVESQRVVLTLSAGIAHGDPGEHIESLSGKASAALAEANRLGPGTITAFVRDLDTRGRERLELHAALQGAVARGELFLLFQPQFDAESMQLVGAEALLRWNHPERGLVSPAEFMPLAEESALILPIGRWVVRTAAEHVRYFHSQGIKGISIAVNVSARQFSDPDFLEDIRAVLDETGIDPGSMELEITESVAMHDMARTVRVMETIRSWGLTLSIDDFGTGFSSLSYLKRLPLHKLKIDQSFVRGLPDMAEDRAIAQAVIELAHRMRLRVVAEGVETPEQLDWLRSHGCDVVQGYLTGRPGSHESLVEIARVSRTLVTT